MRDRNNPWSGGLNPLQTETVTEPKVLDFNGPARRKNNVAMTDSFAIVTHLDNMINTFGEEAVKYVIEHHLKMKRRVIKPEVA